MDTKKRVLQCMVCMFEWSPKLESKTEEESAKIAVHAFINSIFDNCVSLLYGLPQHLLSRLPSVLNTATQIVARTRKAYNSFNFLRS